MRSPIKNETFKKVIQKARRMARPAKTRKPLDHTLFETDFTKLTYRARRLARRATPAKSRDCPVGSTTSMMVNNGNMSLAVSSSNASPLHGTSIQQCSTSTVAHAIQPLLLPMIDCLPAKIFAPTSRALLRQAISAAIPANQIVLPAITRPFLFAAEEPSSGQSQTQIIQTAANMVRRCGMAPLQHQSLPPAVPPFFSSLPLLIPGFLSQQPQNLSQGFHPSPNYCRLGAALSANPVPSFAASRSGNSCSSYI